jgi:hypothetical protein
MEAALTDKLLELSLKDDPDVTRDTVSDCLFLCFVHNVKEIARNGQLPKQVTKDGDKIMAPLPTQWRPIGNLREKVDVSTATGMRLLGADAAKDMLKDHPRSALLKRHILHRFRSACLRERDAEVLGDDVLPDDATEADKLETWRKLMIIQGTRLCFQVFALLLLWLMALLCNTFIALQ